MTHPIGILHPTQDAVLPARKLYTYLMQGGSSAGQTQDWTSTGSTAMANAAAAGIQMIRVTGMTTAGSAAYMFSLNLHSTGVTAPTSGDYNTSTNCNVLLSGQIPQMFQVPGASTGFSVYAVTSGWVMIEAWRK